ncbi:50S ribosomal protein L13 [Candidatus Termititenax persephonae]|uniref:Large ribosomal subunit protein uL13 n=1 Tax=Candidatus Termititenax persephonae TaxID=2218525 RepID=A0A388THD8_9BACT|nr:50S ribosomal protein L13 [Candidatus Termititenax persephonae]
MIDAEGRTLGRLAAAVAKILRGKNKPTFTPNVDGGDFVVIVNADKVRVTGNKAQDKEYHRYSGFPGGLKSVTLARQLQKDSRKVILAAVGGMLPKSRLANKQLTKCKVFRGAEHDHLAQRPVKLEI